MTEEGKLTVHPLHVPEQEQVATLLQQQLTQYFESVHVSVVPCPDLRSAPFHLADAGLGGRPAVCDVGGVPYLVPTAQTARPAYSMSRIADLLGYQESAFFLGAACGPFHVIGTNSELMPNVSVKPDSGVSRNESRCATLDPGSVKGYRLFRVADEASACDDFCLLGNLLLSEGRPGPVIRVSVKKRLTEENFVTAIRTVLHQEFGQEKQVSMGGVFLIKSGKAKVHVMPDFSSNPLTTDADVNNWLQYFEASAPLICLTAFHSIDKGQDLRIEHTHCFSEHGDGGHYHYDTTPDEVEYEAFLTIAQSLVRIDAPTVSHMIGRD